MVSAILHCQYEEMGVNYMGFGAAIPHCQYAEILVKLQALGRCHSILSICRNQYLCSGLDIAIPHSQYSGITLKHKVITNKE